MQDVVEGLLRKDERFVSEDGALLKNKVHECALQHDIPLIRALLGDAKTKKHFFLEVDGALVFEAEKFVQFVTSKEWLPDSYTAFGNKVGLRVGNEYLAQNKDVSLVWPYKDCVLAGGMEKEGEKRDEIFYNETLAPDEISRLLEPKVFTAWKRYTKEGEEAIGEIRRGEDGAIKENLIIKGNNLLALHSLKDQFAGTVKLIYIDPPYNTESDDFIYNDSFTHSTWLTFMRNRLEIARDLLSFDGSIYINIDFNEAHYLKIVMDEIFGRDNFQREIIWRIGWVSGYKTTAHNYIRNHDTIFFYSRTPGAFKFNKIYTTPNDYEERYNDSEKKEIIKTFLEKGYDLREANSMLSYLLALGVPNRYPIEDTWNASRYDKLNSVAITSFSGEKVSKMLGVEELKGQKAEKLLKRIIEISTDEGDIVLDFFGGTGTTGAVANKLRRQYIVVEQMGYVSDTLIPRMQKVLHGEQGGISRTIGWKGGGDFVYAELAKNNEIIVEEIEKAKTNKVLWKVWEELKESGFLSYQVKPEAVDASKKDFEELSLAQQKDFLMRCVNKNHLYVNLGDMDDKTYKVSEEDKRLTKAFYNRGHA